MNMNVLQIGLAPNFYSAIPIETRLPISSNLSIIKGESHWNKDICLFRMPEHLIKKWWKNTAEELLQGKKNNYFRNFLKELISFANFKNIPITNQHYFQILIREPGNHSSNINRKNFDETKICSIINFGDESSEIMVEGEKIFLHPGDGCFSPSKFYVSLGSTINKKNLDVLLLIMEP